MLDDASLPSPSISDWLMPLRSMARLAAMRTRLSCHGDFGSHWSGKSSQYMPYRIGATIRTPGERFSSSAAGPVNRYARSASPVFTAAARVVSSGILRMTSRFTLGALRQYGGKASSTSSTPGWEEKKFYGPGPPGGFF